MSLAKHPGRGNPRRRFSVSDRSADTAIEEAVATAIYHRSYEVREPIEIRISKDDLVILS